MNKLIKRYFQKNRNIIILTGYISIVTTLFLLVLFSSLIKEVSEIENQAVPLFAKIYNYSTMLFLYFLIHVLGSIFTWKKSKSIAIILATIGIFFGFVFLYPFIPRL